MITTYRVNPQVIPDQSEIYCRSIPWGKNRY